MKKVYLRVEKYKDFEIFSTDDILPIERCEDILIEFCKKNDIEATISKISYGFGGDVYIYCKMGVEYLRDFKLKSII